MEAIRKQLTDAGIDCSSLGIFSEESGQPVFQLRLPGGNPALTAVRKMMAISTSTGFSPIILGSPEEQLICDGDRLPEAGQIEDALALASGIDVPEWFSQHHRDRLEDFREFNHGEDASDLFAQEGAWPVNVRPSTSLYSSFDILKRTPLAEVQCLLIPTTETWQAAAYLGFGGWNECPDASVQCAVFKYWHERWGADIVVITHDVVETVVGHPPASRAAAMSLASEQYEFCTDIVDQGTETLSNLAAGLLNGPLWYFWWD